MTLTVRLYAERKKWLVDGVKAHATRQPGEGKPEVIEIAMVVDGDLDAGQRQRLLEISTRCPVHRSLLESVKIVHREP